MLLRDPIHGDIHFEDKERKILDTKEMQKLRGIKQLAASYLVYPGAVHTRFGHSVGTNAVFKRLIREMKRRKNVTQYIGKKDDLLAVSIAALVHDITHVPFGHTFEDEMRIFDKHDKKSRYDEILRRGEIGTQLEKNNLVDEVINLLATKSPIKDLDDPWQSQIISDTICADILDYARRDAFFCGMPSKNYDDRIFSYFDIQEKDGKPIICLDITKGQMDRKDALSELIHLMRLRFFLTERVYLHHSKVCAGAMLAKALSMAKKYGVTKESLNPLSDEGLFDFLLQQPKGDVPDKGISKLINRIKERKLLKRAYILSPREVSHPAKIDEFIAAYHMPNRESERKKREQELSEELKIAFEDVVIYCCGKEMLKEAQVYVTRPDNEIIQLQNIPDQHELKSIMESYEDLWKFYVFVPAEKTREAYELCERMFDCKSGYLPKGYVKTGPLDMWYPKPLNES